MLEQAIIDAAALRETAMKSAEASLIEKYSKEFKDTVEKLLEQDEAAPAEAPAEVDPATASANAADPTGPTVEQPPAADPSAGLGAAPQADKKDVFKKVKSAFFDLEGDEDEMVVINFDQLKAKPAEKASLAVPPAAPVGPAAAPVPENPAPMLASPETTGAAMQESLEIDLNDLQEGLRVKIGEMYSAGHREDQYGGMEEDEEEDEYELEFDELEESAASLSMKKDAGNLKQQAAKKEADAVSMEAADEEKAEKEAEEQRQAAQKAQEDQKELEESIELTEDELVELEESLMVDMENVPEGYMGSHSRKSREFKKVALAKARDDKQTKKREMAKKRLSDLQEGIEHISELYIKEKQKISSLEEDNDKLLSVVSALKEQMEQLNLTNAKLLYTNKVLGNSSLNERQKNTIVENITKAASVSEAKTIYETLQGNVQSVNSNTPKSLSEALNRGPSPFLVRKTQTASINDLMSERMKLLAGIKN